MSIFEANLRALARHNAGLADALRSATPAEAMTFEPSRREGCPSATFDGQRLASRHDPLEEGRRLAATIDVRQNAVVVVLGFGLGYHVRGLAEAMRKAGLVIVFEPDLSMLRAVLERVDHSSWLGESIVVIFTDEEDRASLFQAMDGAGAILAQGTAILEHPASRKRLAERARAFAESFTKLVAVTRTTMVTTLVQSVTTCRNLCLNLDRYALGDGIEDLKGAAAGRTAILVAAGPSLSRNVDRLRDPSVRERAVIVAVQTALKPLLSRGVRPHFVTTLDYHEISAQFYEGLSAEDVDGITLVCDPKVNRAVVEAWPGRVRCIANDFLDRVLGNLARPMGHLRAGATVAHLSFYLAQHLGCDPIALVGQDLGFTEGLYYGPGAAIHEQWATEINAFNTLEMMEWQRVARMKRTLQRATDQNGRPMHIDEQMRTYLQQFERDFAAAPQRVIDATEGGSMKRGSEIRPLREVLAELGDEPLPSLDAPGQAANGKRRDAVRSRIEEVRQRVVRFGRASRDAAALLERMLEDQRDAAQMERHFARMDRLRAEAESLNDAMDLVNQVNQLGLFNRFKADRELHMAAGSIDALEAQRRQMERDRKNVTWLADAADELAGVLEESLRVLDGRRVDPRISHRAVSNATSRATNSNDGEAAVEHARPRRVAAMIAVDPARSSLLIARRLEETFLERTALQCTLERLGRCRRIESIVLLAEPATDVESLIDRETIGRPVVVHRVDRLRDEAHRAIAIARRWSDCCWRGGLHGTSIYDEIIAPGPMKAAMESLGLDAALVVGDDWVLVDPSDESGCGAVVARHLEQPDSHRLVFTPAPPGLTGCVVTPALLAELSLRARFGTVGGMLSYMPHLPQLDPIGKDMCVRPSPSIRTWPGRATFDTAARRRLLREAFERHGEDVLDWPAERLVETLRRAAPFGDDESDETPRFLEVEITAERLVEGSAAPRPVGTLNRARTSLATFERIVGGCAARDDFALTIGGSGDPLLHPEFERFIRRARELGVEAIHVRTDLLVEPDAADRLLDLPIDVLSVRLNADREATYRRAMGSDRFREAIANLERLLNARAGLAGHAAAIALPWIVPTLSRGEATLEDVETFFDRWVYYAGAAVIEPAADDADGLIRLAEPDAAAGREARRWMAVRADGTVAARRNDWGDGFAVGRAGNEPITTLWRRVLEARLGPDPREAMAETAPEPDAEPTAAAR